LPFSTIVTDCGRSFAVQGGHDAALAFFVAAKGVRVFPSGLFLATKGIRVSHRRSVSIVANRRETTAQPLD
jgi:hypothetical protein